jgi:hypothetical protein
LKEQEERQMARRVLNAQVRDLGLLNAQVRELEMLF